MRRPRGAPPTRLGALRVRAPVKRRRRGQPRMQATARRLLLLLLRTALTSGRRERSRTGTAEETGVGGHSMSGQVMTEGHQQPLPARQKIMAMLLEHIAGAAARRILGAVTGKRTATLRAAWMRTPC